jgi:phosphoglucomutase
MIALHLPVGLNIKMHNKELGEKFNRDNYIKVENLFKENNLNNIKKILEMAPYEELKNPRLTESHYLVLNNSSWIQKLRAVLIEGEILKIGESLFNQPVKIDGLFYF